jgi:hypothetical protein
MRERAAVLPDNLRTPSILSAALAAVMFSQAALGILLPREYRDVEWIKTTWFGNDWATLVLAVPLLGISVMAARRGSRRGILIWLGLIAYAVYNYAYYLLGAALNAFFLLYVAAVVLAAITLILVLTRLNVADVAAGFSPRTPVRIIGGYFAFVGLSLAAVWVVMWAAYVFAGRSTPIEPGAFKLVAALDISLMAPVLTVGGALLWRRKSWGYVISAISGIQSSLYLLVLSVNSVVAVQRGLAEPPGEVPMWGTLALLTTGFTVILLSNIRRERAPMPIRYLLGSLLAFFALNAFGGGYYGLSGADGVPVEWLEGTPFSDYVVPSLILLVVVGGSFLTAAIAVFAGLQMARLASFFAGLVVLGWLVAQVSIIGYVSWMQPATAAAGLMVLLLGWLLPPKPFCPRQPEFSASGRSIG